MAIINGLGPRKLRVEQHGQVFRILDQNNVVYCETKNESDANLIVESRNNNRPRQKRYVQIKKTVEMVLEVDSASDIEAHVKAEWEAANLIKRNRAQWHDATDDVSKMITRLVQENEYEVYRRWRDSWRP